MALFNGRILIPDNVKTALLVGVVGLLTLIEPRVRKSELLLPLFFFLAFLFLDGMYLMSAEDIAFPDLYHAYMASFTLLLLAGFAASLPVRVGEKLFLSILVVVFAANFVIAVMQYVTQDPILPTQSADQSWVVASDIFVTGDQRAFGLFASGLGLGLFCSFIGGLGASYCRTFRETIRFGLPLILASAFATFATQTRIAIITYPCSIISVFLLSRPRWKSFAQWLPLLWGGVGILIVLQTTVFGFGSAGASMQSNQSMQIRIAEWAACFGEYTSATFVEQLFGMGMAPGSGVDQATLPTKHMPFPIDNAGIITLLYIGAVGLLFLLSYLWGCWKYILRQADESKSPLPLAIAAFWSTALLSGMFITNLLPLGGFMLMSALCTASIKKKVSIALRPVNANMS
jgi:hypothetical protein